MLGVVVIGSLAADGVEIDLEAGVVIDGAGDGAAEAVDGDRAEEPGPPPDQNRWENCTPTCTSSSLPSPGKRACAEVVMVVFSPRRVAAPKERR